MKRIITYGSFDLLHYGHIELLRRAKAMGDYLIVALSTDEFSASKGKRAYFTYEQRKAMLEAVRYVDMVVPEQTWGQKSRDIDEYGIDVFVIGDDWIDTFNEQLEGRCEIVYLPRTPEIDSLRMQECRDAVGVAQQVLALGELVNDLPLRQCRQIRVRPGVVGQLDLSRFHEGKQLVPVVGPARVDTCDEEGEADSRVLGEVKVGVHH